MCEQGCTKLMLDDKPWMKQDLAPIAPKKRIGSTQSNKEILERRHTQTNTHHKCNIHYDLTN